MTYLRVSDPLIDTAPTVDTLRVCAITGELDILEVENFRTELLNALGIGETIVVDLRSVTFFSISALRALLEVQRLADVRHCRLLILGSRCVDRVLELNAAVTESDLPHEHSN